MTGERMTTEQLGRELADAFSGVDMDAPPGYAVELAFTGDPGRDFAVFDPCGDMVAVASGHRSGLVAAWHAFSMRHRAWAEWILAKARGE